MVKLSEHSIATLRCPCCRSALHWEHSAAVCAGCGMRFPDCLGAPVLINEAHSVCRFADYETAAMRDSFAEPPKSVLRRMRESLPSISGNVGSDANIRQFAEQVRKVADHPRVLVVGGRVLGDGCEEIASAKDIELVETDIIPGPRVQLICDAHDLPFADASFDGVIIQAVLEHVCAPWQCVEEIHRVLKPNGLVYAETPFMQQVHGGAYDFTRFSDLGHRRLFRRFDEVDRGMCCGPGMALAWSIQYFLLSFSGWRVTRAVVRVFTELTLSWLKYLDRVVVKNQPAYNAASGFFFLGRRSESALSDRELVSQWRGMT